MTTRKQIRRRAVHLAPKKGFATADGVASLTATAGTTLSISDTANLPPTGASTALYTNWRIHRPAAANAADVIRIVSQGGYTASTRTLAHQGPVYTEDPLESTDTGEYELLADDPLLWNRAINEALRTECFFIQFDEWTPSSNTRRIYKISDTPISLSDILRVTDIHNIQWRASADASNEEFWRDWDDGAREWEVFEDSGTLYIDFRHVPPGTAQKMRIISTQPYAGLTTEVATSDVDEEWAANATLLVMSRWLGDNDSDWEEIGAGALQAVRDRRRQELGRYAYRTVGRESQFVGAVSVAGRGGQTRGRVNRRTFHN